jgi:sterol desaturase/sphingolipid hydroxylase (fatty acid hydroxylase superfamily)
MDILLENIRTVAVTSAAIAAVMVLEAAIPWRARGRWHRAHVAPNLALTFLTFAMGVVLNTGLIVWLLWLDARDFGMLRALALPPWAAAVAGIVALDFAYYVLHVAMHHVPALWRVHRVHHSDPVLDVTSSIRQHPIEGLLRYATIFAAVSVLGVSVGAFAVYRVWSLLNALLEHANLRLPRWIDRTISLVSVSPDMHRVHHSRLRHETDSNYGNIFSWFDRALATFTPVDRGRSVQCGLDGFDDPDAQTTVGLLRMPFDNRVPLEVARASL